MSNPKAILEQWFARTVERYGTETASFLTAEKDQFRNPIGHTLRENLAILVEQLLAGAEGSAAKGDAAFADAARVRLALENIIRIRAVQNLTATQAVEFVLLVRPILNPPGAVELSASALLNHRIDQLALLAFDEYVRCRERVADIRANESLRAVRPPSMTRASGQFGGEPGALTRGRP